MRLPLIARPLDAVVGAARQRAGRWLLDRTMRKGIDLRKLRFLPEAVQLPLRRDGLDPLPELMRLQAEAPVKRIAEMFGRGVWLVSGYDEARAVLAGGAELWSNDLGQFVSQEGRSAADQIGGLGMTDPPLHTELRRYLTPEFTMRRLARLQPTIEATVRRRLDAMEAAGRNGQAVDLVQEFAFAVPFDVICDLLGLPVADRARFFDLGVARFDLSEGGAGVFGAAAHTREFLINAVREQRANPGDGLIGALLEEYGEDLDDVTLGGVADGVFLGGYETSASMLALGAYLIATTPRAGAMLRSDPDSVERVVEELLRHLCVVQLAFVRFAKQDVSVGDQVIRKGDAVGVSLMAANRDPRLGEGLDTFDPTREPVRHLSFGWGMHRCVGAELARMELRTALRMLAQRFPEMTMAANISELDFRKLSAVYGVEALPVKLSGGEPDAPIEESMLQPA
jgi:cytochrome P450